MTSRRRSRPQKTTRRVATFLDIGRIVYRRLDRNGMAGQHRVSAPGAQQTDCRPALPPAS
jgi:hypothetical protein